MANESSKQRRAKTVSGATLATLAVLVLGACSPSRTMTEAAAIADHDTDGGATSMGPVAGGDAPEPALADAAVDGTDVDAAVVEDAATRDADRCAVDNGGCSPDAQCVDAGPSTGATMCFCKSGYTGDGRHCHVELAKLAVSDISACAIGVDGSLWCWGDNRYGQVGLGAAAVGHDVTTPTRVGADADWTQIAMRSGVTCGIRAGALYCWGNNVGGALGLGDEGAGTERSVPTRVGTFDDWLSVSVGGGFACGIRGSNGDRFLYCWGTVYFLGTKDLVPRQRTGDDDWTEVSCGNLHACALRHGAAYCFGYDFEGEVGQGAGTSATDPTRVGNRADYAHVAAGIYSSCATTLSGNLVCWGASREFPGTWDGSAMPSPTVVSTWADWKSVSLADTSCGLRAPGELWCWNQDSAGGPRDPALRRFDGYTDYEAVSVTSTLACALRAGEVTCWGSNYNAQLGVGDELPGHRAEPTLVSPETNWSSIAAQRDSTCAVRGQQLSCWGSLPKRRAATPAPFGFAATWSHVTPGFFATALANGRPQRWGYLGGATVDAPEADDTNSDWVWLASNADGSLARCGIRAPGASLYCWGENNSFGILGVGDTQDRATATRVGSSQTWSAVTLGMDHACGIDAGLMYCWGNNQYGQLGLGTSGAGTSEPAPKRLDDIAGWTSVSAGWARTCGIRGGRLYCWGADGSGAPTQLTTAADFTSVSHGRSHACAIRSDGSLWCWGYNPHGQLGLGEAFVDPSTYLATPTQVPGAWTSVTCGGEHTCAMTTAGELWCWGDNGSGQLGSGPSWSDVPVTPHWQ